MCDGLYIVNSNHPFRYTIQNEAHTGNLFQNQTRGMILRIYQSSMESCKVWKDDFPIRPAVA